ncbi:adenylate cyclase 1 [bacterium BMS3Bbin14]|nr:adenylate cyclase 1 [bacterium BMS3Bbin14]HDO29441.1 MerR family transcriptional regulator [Desulfobacteraceae bacterium]
MSDLITSKEIIDKTGISRATLNNYIKLGILPKPIVGRPRSGQQGVKQIGYFPPESLESIFKVKLLKTQGHSIAEIAAIFQKDEEGSAPSSSQVQPQDERGEQDSRQSRGKVSRACSSGNLSVTICDIDSPAYLVNHNFEIEWINKPAEDLIFKQRVRSLVDIESRNVFRLLLNQGLGSTGQSWQELISLNFTILQKAIDKDRLGNLFKGMTRSESELMQGLFESRKPAASRDAFYHLPVSVVADDHSRKTYWVHTMTFREGIFFVFLPDEGINSEFLDMLTHREKVINALLRNRMPSLVSLGVLVADLQDSVKISAELLPGQYFELINGLWEVVGPTFERYGGIYGKHAGDGMLYYFIHKNDGNYLMNALDCALEVREVVSEFSSRWRAKKSWNNELFLNTGINEGQEFFGTIHSARNVEFTALGDTINIAGRLSEFARNGEIWTTKNLISKLSQEERETICFGIYQKNRSGRIFIRDSFSRISDLVAEDPQPYRHFESFPGLPITLIEKKVNHLTEHQEPGSILSA